MSYATTSRTADILRNGAYDILPPETFTKEVADKIYALILSGVEEIESATARQTLEEMGLTKLHKVLAAEKIGLLRDYVMQSIRPDLFTLACRIGREHLGIEGEFFIDDYTILRINYPFEVARHASNQAENPGIGRMSAEARADFLKHKKIDPVYNPKEYHQDLPPPAWAHGPHLDTWTGHSRDGINIWWAIDETLAENSMVFYPEYWDKHPQPEPKTLYIKAGYPLSVPEKIPLRKGEMLVFNPELLHGTHLNVTDSTRIAVSFRLNPDKPRFSRHCFYAREYWQSSQNIEQGNFDQIVQFQRDDNLIPEDEEITQFLAMPQQAKQVFAHAFSTDQENPICAADAILPGTKTLLEFSDKSLILLCADNGEYFCFDALCPHLAVNLMDGGHDEEGIYCPADGVKFSLRTGTSEIASLQLPCYQVSSRDGSLFVSKQAK